MCGNCPIPFRHGSAATRRGFLLGLVGVTGSVLISCTTNPLTGEEQFIIVSQDQLTRMSLQSWSQIKDDTPELKDRAEQRRLRRLGERIVAVSGIKDRTWEFVVFDSEQVNAFALPGGKVGIYTGILELMENDSQLATVVGHEVGHVAGRHGAERVSQAMAANVGMQAAAAAMAIGDISGANAIIGLLGAGVTYGVILPYSRAHETEADELGVQYMAKAGYNPEESVKFWQTMAKQGGQRPPEFMSTHPAPETRIRNLQRLVPRWYPVYQRNKVV